MNPSDQAASSHGCPNRLALWVAQGFGAGFLKPAPGTWGSVVGLLWLVLLLLPGSMWTFVAGMAASIVLCVWLCDGAEKRLGTKDPPSVVLDEIVAMPVCFLGPVAARWWGIGDMPAFAEMFSRRNILLALGLFTAFRVFDIWKPWPARQSQDLPGGWGITLDDLIAGVYVNLSWCVVWWLNR